MSEGTRVKTAEERAAIAAKLLKGVREPNEDLGRRFDDCFEMDDADDVVRLLIERAKDDLALRIGIRRNWQIAPCELTRAVNQISSACEDFRVAANAGLVIIATRVGR